MKALGTTKWCSLFILTTGVALIQLPRGEVKAKTAGVVELGSFSAGAGEFLERVVGEYGRCGG